MVLLAQRVLAVHLGLLDQGVHLHRHCLCLHLVLQVQLDRADQGDQMVLVNLVIQLSLPVHSDQSGPVDHLVQLVQVVLVALLVLLVQMVQLHLCLPVGLFRPMVLLVQ